MNKVAKKVNPNIKPCIWGDNDVPRQAHYLCDMGCI